MPDWRPREVAGPPPGAPAGWATPFPPEKPRRDAPGEAAPAATQPAPNQYQAPYGAAPAAPGVSPRYGAPNAGFAPPAGMPAETYAAAAVPGVPLYAPKVDPMTENRRHLDWRRIRATRIDGLLMVPVAIALLVLAHGHPVTVWFLVMAINLSYHFVMETACGQTFGKRWKNLRVVKRDGSPAGASAIAARTVFRIVDAQFLYLVGLLTMVITGKRRQRVGDLAAGTIVREDDRPWKPARSSPLLVIYPVLWVSAALFFGSQLDPKLITPTSDPYMQQIDQICAQRMFAEASVTGNESFLQIQQISLQETRAIKALPPPTTQEAVYGRQVVLRWKKKIDKTAAKIVADSRTSGSPQTTLDNEMPRLLDVIKQADTHMADLGLPHCAKR
jgi:uncharacterized RDD family membrane protein YckC